MTTDPFSGDRTSRSVPPGAQPPFPPRPGSVPPPGPAHQTESAPLASHYDPQSFQAQQRHQQPFDQPNNAATGAPGGPAPSAAGQKNPYTDFSGYQVRMPSAWPTSVRAGLPSFRGGIGSIFQTAHMPMDARIGYWIWLIGSALTIVGWFFSIAAILIGILFNPVILMATGMMSLFGDIRWGTILFYIATMILQLIMLVLQLLLTLKIREGAEWARLGLTAITVLSIVYAIILTAADLESGGAGTVVVSILSLALIAFFWLPQANAWFIRSSEGVNGSGGSRRIPRH